MTDAERTMFIAVAAIFCWEIFKFSMEMLKDWIEGRGRPKPHNLGNELPDPDFPPPPPPPRQPRYKRGRRYHDRTR